jgi:hypothetical protein
MLPSLRNEIARKDFFTSLGIWTALELVCFGLLPLFGLAQPKASLQIWFYASFPIGLGGALLIGFSSYFISISMQTKRGILRTLRILLGDIACLIGVIAIAFPLLAGSIEIFTALFKHV